VLIVVAAILAGGAGTVLAVRLLGDGPTGPRLNVFRRGRERSLEEVLQRADDELSMGYLGRAEELLDEGYPKARGEAGYLRLLKRELLIARARGDFRRFARRSREAARDLRGSRRLAETAAYAALRSEHPESSAALLADRSIKGNLQGLAAEAHLREYLPEFRSAELEGRLGLLVRVPRVSEPGELHTLAGLLDDPRADLDAALLWMKQGEADQAFAVLWPHRNRPEFGEALLHVAFDAGRFQEAWELQNETASLRERPDLLLLRADLAWLLARPEIAASQYQRALDAFPEYSWTPYLNLASLLEAAGDSAGARDFRRRAHARFSGQPEVVLAYVRDLAAAGERQRASELLDRLLEQDPGRTEAQLLAFEIKGLRSSPAVFQGRMWELLNQNPGQPGLVRTFALYLIGIRDLDGASAVMRQYTGAVEGPEPPWLLELRGFLALAEGRPAEAADFFQDSLSGRSDWRGRYNLALALFAAERYAETVQELVQCETELAAGGASVESAPGRRIRSLIRSRIAAAQVRLGELDSAHREAQYALDLDAGNHHARQVLRILDGIR
jgi:predicted Zn-dependent protease